MTVPAASSPHAGLSRALANGFRAGLRHWRLIVLGWLASLLPAALAALPVSRLANRALGQHPDAARLVRGSDLAPLVDAFATLPDGGLSAAAQPLADGLMLAAGIALLLMPWLAGMLVASLRARRALGFGELWNGGWREYGRQFRLLLVSLIAWFIVAIIASMAAFWAGQGEDSRILHSVGQQRRAIASWAMALAALLAWTSVEAGRAAFAADAGLRSAFHAWLRGLQLMARRPFAVLLIVLLTAGLGLATTLLLQQPSLDLRIPAARVLLWAQLTVAVLWWLRVTRLCALSAISPVPAPRTVSRAVSAAMAPPLPAAPPADPAASYPPTPAAADASPSPSPSN